MPEYLTYNNLDYRLKSSSSHFNFLNPFNSFFWLMEITGNVFPTLSAPIVTLFALREKNTICTSAQCLKDEKSGRERVKQAILFTEL